MISNLVEEDRVVESKAEANWVSGWKLFGLCGCCVVRLFCFINHICGGMEWVNGVNNLSLITGSSSVILLLLITLHHGVPDFIQDFLVRGGEVCWVLPQHHAYRLYKLSGGGGGNSSTPSPYETLV